MKTKEILKEWRIFLNESSLQTLEAKLSDLGYKEQYEELFSMKTGLGNLKDPYFNMIILNTFEKDPEVINNHGIEAFVSLYREYATHIQPFQNDRDQLIVKLNSGAVIDFNEMLDYSKKAEGNVTATYEDVVSFINTKLENKDMSSKKTQKRINEELKNAMSGKSHHFDFISEDESYIVFYPKTQFSSRVIARSMYVNGNLIYDNSASTGVGKLTGKLSWCTASSGEGNAFLSYKKGNKHMYYCLKKFSSVQDVLDFVESDSGGYRKLCLSFMKRNNQTFFAGGTSCVNANNQLRDEEWFKNTLKNLFNSLLKDASSPEKLDFDQESYYKSINLAHYRDLRKTAGEEETNDFLNELQEILVHSHAKNEIVEDVMIDPEPRIKNKIFNSRIYKSLNDNLKNKIKYTFINDKDEDVRSSIVKVANFDYVQDREIIDNLVNSHSSEEQRSFFVRTDIHEIDPSLDLLERIVGIDFFNQRNNSINFYYKLLYRKNPEKYYNENLLASISETSDIEALKNIIQGIEKYKNSEDAENIKKINEKIYNEKINSLDRDSVFDLFTPLNINSHYNNLNLNDLSPEQLSDKEFVNHLEENILPEQAKEINSYFNFYICYLADVFKNDFMGRDDDHKVYATRGLVRLVENALHESLPYAIHSSDYSKKIKLNSESIFKLSDIVVDIIESGLPSILEKSKSFYDRGNRKELERVFDALINFYKTNKEIIKDLNSKQNFEKIVQYSKNHVSEIFDIPNTFKNASQAKTRLSRMLEKALSLILDDDSRGKDKFDIDLFFKNSIKIISQYGASKGDCDRLLNCSTKANYLLSKEDQLIVLDSLGKSDYLSQGRLLKYAYIDKDVYILALEKYLPVKGSGNIVYNNLLHHQMIYTMMKDVEVVNCIIDFSTKAFFDNICLFFTRFLTDDRFEQVYGFIELDNESIDNFYNCLTSNANALKSKNKVKNFIKAYKENIKSNESYLLSNEIIIEKYIKKYLSLIIK